jgi:hypothetical protein
MTSQNVTEFVWDERRQRAALELAQAWIPDELIAKHAHVSRRQFARWKEHPAFQARVAEHQRLFDEHIKEKGLADRQNRVAAMNGRWLELQRVVMERAADPQMQSVPGGTTGLLVHQTKMIGQGTNATLIDEYAVDTGLLKELRDLEKQAAQDLGQWVERRSVNEDEFTFAKRYAKEQRGLSDEEAERVARAVVGRSA